MPKHGLTNDNNLLELNLTKTCFINFSINKSSPIGNNYLKPHKKKNCNEFSINTVIAINNDSRCNCTTIFYPVQKVKYLGDRC